MRLPFVVSMSRHAVVSALMLACGLAVASCDSDAPRASNQSAPSPDSDSAPPSAPVASASPDTVPLGVHSADELVDAATAVVAFLRGEADFGRIRLADTVTLLLSPEGGGTRRTVARELLRNPASWTVRSRGLPNAPGVTYSFVPPKGEAALTTRVGRHLKCREYPLSSIDEELARLPHVGTMLMFDERGGCLSSSNLTLVFDPKQKPPTLVAAVYDQWEW